MVVFKYFNKFTLQSLVKFPRQVTHIIYRQTDIVMYIHVYTCIYIYTRFGETESSSTPTYKPNHTHAATIYYCHTHIRVYTYVHVL